MPLKTFTVYTLLQTYEETNEKSEYIYTLENTHINTSSYNKRSYPSCRSLMRKQTNNTKKNNI